MIRFHMERAMTTRPFVRCLVALSLAILLLSGLASS